ncbi:hypothetical protein L3X38_025738 [Prunus dulcis]|uniref:Uncharacterized protein n=1 Tax=Prunus dulcis TaxID=3755 RepID=A0AAD4Z7B8_PRUDU|nr:hypothetical protein L3X38_025738 [Prunus dulcis]
MNEINYDLTHVICSFMCPVEQLQKFGKKEKHLAFNRCHSCQLFTNGILVKNIVELIKKRNKDELERKRVKVQRRRRPYGGPIRIYTATKDSLRSLNIVVKLGVCAYWEIVVLDPFPTIENNTFMAARCDKED